MHAYRFDPATPRTNHNATYGDWTTIDTFEHAGYTVTLAYAPDDDFSAAGWEHPEDAEGYDPMIMRVQVSVDSIVLGSEYLGGCLYDNPTAFIDGGYFQDMVNAALDAAQKNAARLVEKFSCWDNPDKPLTKPYSPRTSLHHIATK